MDDVSFLGQDHASQTHAGTPKIIARPSLPETKQAEDEQHREEARATPRESSNAHKNKTRAIPPLPVPPSTYGSSNEWLELQC